MGRSPRATDDPLLWQVRRSLARARSLAPQVDDYRQALALTVELRDQIQSLSARLAALEAELAAVSSRTVAATAYHRCAALGRR